MSQMLQSQVVACSYSFENADISKKSADNSLSKLIIRQDKNTQSLFCNENSALSQVKQDENLDYQVDYTKELNKERSLNKNFNPLVKYNKKPFKTLVFTNFTPLDFNLFITLCFIAKEKGDLKIKVSFKDLEFLMGRVERNQKRLIQKYKEFAFKASKTTIYSQNSEIDFAFTPFFKDFRVFGEKKIIILQFNDLMVSALNGFHLTRFYTQFELDKFCSLSSKYSKQLYLLLMNEIYKDKDFEIDKNELYRYFELDKKPAYSQEINFQMKILDRIKSDLKDFFKNFEILKIYDRKNKNKVIAYRFVYDK